jgi:hypothetical protein
MANNDPLGLFEDERDPETGDLVLSEVGERFGEVIRESMKDIVDDRMGAMVEAVDQYFQEDVTDHVNDLVEDNVAEIRKLMLLAISTISGSEKTREFIRKVAELARAGALSSATGAWAQADLPTPRPIATPSGAAESPPGKNLLMTRSRRRGKLSMKPSLIWTKTARP